MGLCLEMKVANLNPQFCALSPHADGSVVGMYEVYGVGSGTVVGAGRRASGRRVSPVISTNVATTVAAACLLLSSAAPALSLRLDTELTTKPSAKGADAVAAQLIRFGTSDLQRRVFESRQRTDTVRTENRILREQISGIEALISHMQNFSGGQERTLGVLKTGIAWQQTARALAQSAVSAPMASLPLPVVAGVQTAPPIQTATQAATQAAT